MSRIEQKKQISCALNRRSTLSDGVWLWVQVALSLREVAKTD